MYSSINFYICINPCHRNQIKLRKVLEPILEGSHMSSPSRYSSAPKTASVLIFITIESFAWFWAHGFTQCVFDVKTCRLCSFSYSLGQTQVPNSKLSTVKTWGCMTSALRYTMTLGIPLPSALVSKMPCPQGVDKPPAICLRELLVTESGSNRLCLPHLSPFILHPVTANIFHPSGSAGGKGGCGWGLSRWGAGLPSWNVWALSAHHFELFLTLSLVQEVLDAGGEEEGRRGVVSHLGKRRCPSPSMHMGPIQVWASHLETWAGKLGRVSTGVEVMQKRPAQPEGALSTVLRGRIFFCWHSPQSLDLGPKHRGAHLNSLALPQFHFPGCLFLVTRSTCLFPWLL